MHGAIRRSESAELDFNRGKTMSIKIRRAKSGEIITFKIAGEFTSASKHQIQDVVEKYGAGICYQFDFAAVNKVYSSAVGMLIVLRQSLGGADANIKLVNCGAKVREVLYMAGLQSLFAITRPETEELEREWQPESVSVRQPAQQPGFSPAV